MQSRQVLSFCWGREGCENNGLGNVLFQRDWECMCVCVGVGGGGGWGGGDHTSV